MTPEEWVETLPTHLKDLWKDENEPYVKLAIKYVLNNKKLSDSKWIAISSINQDIKIINSPKDMRNNCKELLPPLRAFCVGSIRDPSYNALYTGEVSVH